MLNFGFGSAYIRYYSRYKVKDDEENIAKLNGMFLIVFSIIGVIAVLAGSVLVYMVFNMAISFPASVFNFYITANEEYVFQKIIQMVKTVVNPFIMLPVLLMGYKSVGMVVVTTSLTI